MRRCALLVVLCLGVLSWQPASALSLGSIRNSLIQWALEKVSVEGVFEISADSVVDAESEGTTLIGVKIADAEGVWFTAEKLTFDFNRARLLLGQLIIDDLMLEGVEMLRQPVIPAGEEIEVNLEGVEAPPEPGFYWPRSPVTTAIKRLALDDVYLHEPVLGQAIRFDATGSFRDQGDIQSAALDLRRTDETEGVIDFAYSRDFGADTLSLKLDAHEAPGGLVAGLAGLPPDVPVAVSLKAEGTPDAFETTFDLALTGFVEAAGNATIDYAGPLSIDGEFVIRPGPRMPEEYARLLGEQAELIVRASEGPDRTVRIDTARIDSPYLDATVAGTYARATGAIDAEVELVAAPELAAPLEGVAFNGLRFQGHIQGVPGALTADGALVMDGLETPQLGVDTATLDIALRQSGPLDATVTEVTADGQVAGLRIDRVGADVIGDARIELAATLTGDEVLLETAVIDSNVLDFTASGSADIATGNFAVDYRVTTPALGPVLGAYGIEGTGAIDATGRAASEAGVLTLTTTAELSDFETPFAAAESLVLDGTIVQSATQTTFDLTGTGEALRIGEIGPEVLERADLGLTGTLEGDVLTLDAARLDSPVLDITAEGRVNTATGTGRIDVDVASGGLAPVAAAYGYELDGALAAAGTVELTPGGWVLTADAALTDLAGAIDSERLALQARIDQTKARTAFDVTAESEMLSVELAGERLSGPVDLALRGAIADQVLTLETARIASPVLDAGIEGRFDLADFSGSLSYGVGEGRLAAIAPLLGIDATGVLAAQGTAALAPATAGGAATVEGTAALADLAVSGTFIGDLAATYDLALADAPAGTLRLELTESPYAPDAPTVFTLEMGGPPSDWDLAFDLTAPNYLSAAGTAALSWAGPLSVSVEATARPGPKLPQEYAQLLGDEASLVVEAAEDADGTIRIGTARLSSPVLRAQATGTWSPKTGAADLDIGLVAEPGLAAPLEGVEFAGLRFDGQVTGAPGSLSADGELVLKGFASQQAAVDSAVLRIDIGQTGTAEAPVTDIAVEGVVDGLRVAGIGPEAIGQARIGLDATLAGDALTIEAMRIDSDLVQLRAEGTLNVATMAFDLDYDLAAPALGPLAGAFGIEATGALEATGRVTGEDGAITLETQAGLTDLQSPYADAERLTISGKVTQEGDRTAFDLTGTGAGLRIDRLGPDVLGRAEFAARGALEGDGVTLDALSIASPVVKATAQGTVDLATGKGRLAYEVTEVALAAISPAYDLPVTGTASAEGVLGLAAETGAATGAAGPRLVGEARVADLAYAGTAIGDVVLTHDVVLSAAPHGTLELALTDGPYAPATVATAFRLEGQRLVLESIEARGFGATAAGDLAVNLETLAADGALRVRAGAGPLAPAEARAKLRLAGDRLMLENLVLQAAGLTAAGDVTVNLDTLLAEGVLRIDDADLSALSDLAGAPVTGAAEGTLRLAAEGGRQAVALDLGLLGVNAYGVAIGEARIEGRIADALGMPRLDLTVTAEAIVSGDTRLATATATAQGPLSAVEIALDAKGELGDAPLTVSAAARADLAGAATRVTVTRLQIGIGEDRIALMEPLTVIARGSTLQVDDIRLSLPDGGLLAGDFAWYGGPMAGTLRIDAPDISFLGPLLDTAIEAGALQVAATFDTRRRSAGADITVKGRNIVTAGLVGSDALSIDAALDWNGTILNFDARATGGFDQPLVIEASLPVRATGGMPALAAHGPVSARIDWEGELGKIWGLVPLAGHVLTGRATIDISVSGDISSPVVTGGFRLADGIYQNLDFGLIVTGLSLATQVDSAGMEVRLDTVDADANIVLQGHIGLDGRGTEITARTRRALVLRRDDAILRADVDLRITEDPDGQLAVAGTVEILEAEVRLVNATPPEIVTLGEVRIKGQPLVITEEQESLPIRLNIDIVAPGRIFVRGRGLDSQWDLDLEVRGTAGEPRITGKIAAVRGSLDLIGREFELARGEVLFNGGPVIDPRIDIVLVREAEGLTGRIIISGSASDPKLSFSSTPALPEGEVLPRLLFGTSSQALAPAQGLQLALGLATLMDGGGGTLDQVRAAVGLDSLSIEQGDEGAVLEVGKQVGEDVWVGTRQSLEGAGTTVAVEVEVFGNVEAYGEVGTDGDTTVGVQWRKDF